VFFEIVFAEEHEITAAASYQAVELIDVIVGQMLLQLVDMQSLEFTQLTPQLLEINVGFSHRYVYPAHTHTATK